MLFKKGEVREVLLIVSVRCSVVGVLCSICMECMFGFLVKV